MSSSGAIVSCSWVLDLPLGYPCAPLSRPSWPLPWRTGTTFPRGLPCRRRAATGKFRSDPHGADPLPCRQCSGPQVQPGPIHHRALALFGPSGVGKTSLLLASVRPGWPRRGTSTSMCARCRSTAGFARGRDDGPHGPRSLARSYRDSRASSASRFTIRVGGGPLRAKGAV